MNQKTYWNNAAAVKEFTTPFQTDVFKKYVPKNAKILDFGCGYGRTLNYLYDNGYKNCFGIDFSEKMIERGKKLYPHLSFEVAETINYPENAFDAVILSAVLTCIISDKEQTKLLDKIKNVLKPDAVIYINDFLLNSGERNKKRYEKYESKYKNYGVFELEEGAILRHHSGKWVKKCLEIFNELEYKEVEYTTMNSNKSNGYYYLGKNDIT